MNQSEIDKINRFSSRLPDHLLDHWNEIIEIINANSQPNDVMLSEAQMYNIFLEKKLKDAFKNVHIFKIWMQEKKITSRTGFNNMIDFISTNIKKDIINYDS